MTCVYINVEDYPYTCYLSANNLPGNDNTAVILGDHDEGRDDSQVTHVYMVSWILYEWSENWNFDFSRFFFLIIFELSELPSLPHNSVRHLSSICEPSRVVGRHE